jgi:hypothetical protein
VTAGAVVVVAGAVVVVGAGADVVVESVVESAVVECGVVFAGAGVTVAAAATPKLNARLAIAHPVAKQADVIHPGPRLMCPLASCVADWSGEYGPRRGCVHR